MSKLKFPHASGNSMSIGAPATNPASDLELKLPATIGTAGQVLKNSSTPGTLEFGAAGKILQVVQATTHSTNNYASVDFQNTIVTVNITPVNSSSKFLIKSVVHFGIGSEDCATSFNFSDSLHASGTTHPIAPMSSDGNNGAAGQRLMAYFGQGSFAGTSVDDFFLGNAYGEFLYTPASASSSQRAFTVMVRSAEGINVRFNMNGQYNAANPRDIRATSSITIMEVGA